MLAGHETSANLKQISKLLNRDDRIAEIRLVQFNAHPFYTIEHFDKVRLSKLSMIKPSDVFLIRFLKLATRPLWLFSSLLQHDVVFFNSTDSFLIANIDLPLLRIAGIQVVARHCGDDVRYRPLQHGIHSAFDIQQWRDGKPSFFELLIKIYRQRIAETFALTMSTRDHATFQGKQLYHRPYVQEMLPRTTGHAETRPLILHAPSDPNIKGTSYVIEAIKQLQDAGHEFEFLLLTKTSNEKVIDAISRATIVIDQPGAVPARLAVEAMASGCAVIGGNVPELHADNECPIVQFLPNINDLRVSIEALLLNRNLSRELGDRNFYYWEQHCRPELFSEHFWAILNGSANTFHRIPEHEKLLYSAAKTWYEKLAVRLLYGKDITTGQTPA
jgi:glycosyltransferase involved in cell wall biosynthesis